jgi:hypothetical protein
VVDGDALHEVFDVVEIAGNVIRARSAFLFEIGEQLRLRIDRGGSVADATARVRAHTGPDDARVTELEIADVTDAAELGAAPSDAGSSTGSSGGPTDGSP